MMTLTVRIRGDRLPGSRFGEHKAVHVGVQRGREVVNLIPGDADGAMFEFPVQVVRTESGELDYRGPFVHGRRGERFLYLSWGEVAADGTFTMFRRAKLHLSVIAPGMVEAAIESGSTLEGSVGLTDGRGGPLCASVRPPTISWQVSG
jgi:hypothetical protein